MHNLVKLEPEIPGRGASLAASMQSKIFLSAASNPPFCLKAEVGCD